MILDFLEDSEAEAEDSCSDISINSEERSTVLLQMRTDLFINAFASRWIEKYKIACPEDERDKKITHQQKGIIKNELDNVE